MANCAFCGSKLPEAERPVRKCSSCGEPRGWRVYFCGMLLKYVPLLSAVVAVTTAVVAVYSVRLAHKEAIAAERAETRARDVTQKLQVTERAANEAMAELRREIPERDRANFLRRLDVAPGTTVLQLERQVQLQPTDPEAQKKLFLYRALKERD
jgi:hypothetical protein